MNNSKIPALRRWRTRDVAYVNYRGRKYYFGKWGEASTRERYFAFVQRLTSGDAPIEISDDPTVAELVLAFFEARKSYYVKNGVQTRQLQRFRAASEYFLKLYPDLPVKALGPKKLLEVRSVMEKSERFSRTYINTLVSCFRHIIKYGVEIEIVPAEVLTSLQAVAPLKRGRSSAREVDRVKPVSASDVEATLRELSSVVADMVRVQRLTGMRPGEVCAMRAGDLVESGDVLVYVLRSDKTDYKRELGTKKRIPLGPKARSIVLRYAVGASEDDYLFTPAEALLERRAKEREKRKSPITKQTRERDSRRSSRRVAPCYNNNSYRRAIQRAAARAGVPAWSPNQLRHLYATEIREKYGLEAAQACLGHARADVTQIYAERDYKKAEEVARREG